MANENGEMKYIPIDKIRENPVAIRTVDKKTEDYQGLVDSVRAKGILTPILVREVKNPETGETEYGLINGLQRYNAAQDAGLKEIPALVKSVSDGEIIEAQIITNLHTIETKHVEYAKGLQRILMQNPTLTQTELAKRVNKGAEWINQRLNLVKLEANPRLVELVNEGKINVSNAINLAKLPPEEQINFADRAQTMSPQEFIPLTNARIKEIRDAKRKGKGVTPEEFVAVPHFQKMSEVKEELQSGKIGQALVRAGKIKDLETWKTAIAWVLQVDADSVAARKQLDEARKAKLEEERNKKKAEKAEQRAREAAEKAAALA